MKFETSLIDLTLYNCIEMTGSRAQLRLLDV